MKEVIIMAKSANVSVRIEPEIKEEAENILEALGIPVSKQSICSINKSSCKMVYLLK